jgi:SagB-type dehydrogenase family enzyme
MHRQAAARRCSPFPAARLRAARTLVFSLGGDGIEGCNFLTKRDFACDDDLLSFLRAVPTWQEPQELAERFGGLDAETLGALVAMTVLIEEGSLAADREDAFAAGWTWGLPTALMHFCLDGVEILPVEASERLQLEKARTSPSPPLWLTNDHLDDVIALAPSTCPLRPVMAARRTVREAGGIISLEELANCLFAGMGITGETENCVGRLPLSMTPSGGARNPFEAYVFARSVAGLAPGIYHYGAADHTLGRIGDDPPPDLAALVGDQDWASGKPALIVLAAFLKRPMWKYEDGNAYRVMLIEAGHIGQNIALSATAQGLTACPTAALSHGRIRACLGLDGVMEAPVYALALGRPT